MTLKTNFCPDCGKRNSDIHTCSPAYAVEKAKKQAPVAWINAKGDMTYLHGPYNKDDRPLVYETTPPAAQLAQQEPVAWMVYTLDGTSVCVTDNPADFTDKHKALPLYTTPPAAPQPTARRTAWIFEDRRGEKYTPKDQVYTPQEAEISARLLAHKSIGPAWINPPAQPAPTVQEPVAWGIIASNTGRICQVTLDENEIADHNPKHIKPLYPHPPAAHRQWVGLTKEERVVYADLYGSYEAVLAIETKLKEKNT